MSLSEELINGMSDEEITAYAGNVEEPHIVVRNDRYITVPTQLKRIAVQYDHNVETVTFDCPRYWDGIDMSEMVVCVNYATPDGTLGCYAATDVVPDGDIMHFTWTITKNVTMVSGILSFLVCVKKVDVDGNEVNHWNSEICKEMYISSGLESQEIIKEFYPDVLTEILTKLNVMSKTYTGVLLATEWSDAVPYTQKVKIKNIDGSMSPIIDVMLSDDISIAKEEQTAWGYITKAKTSYESITFMCYETKPTVDISFKVKAV